MRQRHKKYLGSYIGNLADRRNKKQLMLISDLISALLIVTISTLFYFDIQNIGQS